MAPDKLAPCLVSPKTNSPSRAQRLVHGAAKNPISYQQTAFLERISRAMPGIFLQGQLGNLDGSVVKRMMRLGVCIFQPWHGNI